MIPFYDVGFQSQYLFNKLQRGATISVVSANSGQGWIFPSGLLKNSASLLYFFQLLPHRERCRISEQCLYNCAAEGIEQQLRADKGCHGEPASLVIRSNDYAPHLKKRGEETRVQLAAVTNLPDRIAPYNSLMRLLLVMVKKINGWKKILP